MRVGGIGYKPNAKIEKYSLDWRADKLMELEDTRGMDNKEFYELRDEIVGKILKKARVVCCTLSASGQERLVKRLKDEFDYLIVDEACQATEPAALIAMNMNAPRVVLVGDHRQLPACTFQKGAEENKFSRSIFERFLDAGLSTYMLRTQYRMHPEISAFPSKQFYDGKLKTHDSMKDRAVPDHLKPFEKVMNGRRLLFIDLPKSKQQTDRNLSKYNNLEAATTVGLTELLKDALKHKSVGVVTPYKSQKD